MSKTPQEMTDDELEVAQSAADGETEEVTESTGEEENAEEGAATEADEAEEGTGAAAEETDPAATEADPAATAEAQSSAVAEEPQKPTGVASKDGSRVLPYAALQAERRSARQASARAERAERDLVEARKQIEDLRAGKSPDSTELTEAEVQQLEADLPEHGKKVRAAFEEVKELKQQVAAAKPKVADDAGDDPVQEAIDQVPLLVEWQHDTQHADKWQRAIDLDNALQNSPKWKDKPAVNRFAHVARLVADEFDIEVPAEKPAPRTKTSSSATPKQTDPKRVIEQAERTPPSTLSDMKGGAVPDHGQADLTKMDSRSMLNRFMEMDPDEIDRQLAKLG